jgi:hypothetical protein
MRTDIMRRAHRHGALRLRGVQAAEPVVLWLPSPTAELAVAVLRWNLRRAGRLHRRGPRGGSAGRAASFAVAPPSVQRGHRSADRAAARSWSEPGSVRREAGPSWLGLAGGKPPLGSPSARSLGPADRGPSRVSPTAKTGPPGRSPCGRRPPGPRRAGPPPPRTPATAWECGWGPSARLAACARALGVWAPAPAAPGRSDQERAAARFAERWPRCTDGGATAKLAARPALHPAAPGGAAGRPGGLHAAESERAMSRCARRVMSVRTAYAVNDAYDS